MLFLDPSAGRFAQCPTPHQPKLMAGGLRRNLFRTQTFRAFGVCYLEEVDVSIRIAEAENVLFFRVLGNGLDDAVLGQESVAGGQLLFWGAFAVGFVEEQRAPCNHEQIQE